MRSASRVTDRGWFHPAGPRYAPSMFGDVKTGTLYGVSYSSNWGDRRFDWVTRRPDGATSTAPLPYGDSEVFPHGAVLYGSMTRDRQGRFYVVGSMRHKPLVLQVSVTSQ